MLFSNLSPEGLLSQSGTASGRGGEWGRRTSPGPRCVHARGGGKRSDVPKTLQGATWHAARTQRMTMFRTAPAPVTACHVVCRRGRASRCRASPPRAVCALHPVPPTTLSFPANHSTPVYVA